MYTTQFTVASLYVQWKCGRVEFEVAVVCEVRGEGGETHTPNMTGHTPDQHSQQKLAPDEVQRGGYQQLTDHDAA